MCGTDHKQSPLFSYVSFEDLVPREHPLRRVKELADLVLHSMSAHFDALHAEGGRPSIAPERLLRASLLQCLFSIRSERALLEHLDFNMAHRWFVGLTLDEVIWDHSTFSANHDRLLKESVMCEFFGGVVAIAEWAELVSDEHFSVDGSLLRAWASHKSMVARDGSDEPPGPDQGRNPEVDFRGKKRSNATHVSRTDPDSRLASEGGGMAFLSYTTHALAENRHGLIVDVQTTPATVAADRDYDTAEFVGALTAPGIAPHVAAKTQGSAVPKHIKTTEGYRVSLRRRKMIEEAFGWVKDIGTLRRLMARGLDKIRAHALLNFAAYNLTRLGNLLAP